MPNFREGSWKVEAILPSLTKQESNMTHTQVLPSKQPMSRPQSLKTAGTGVGVGGVTTVCLCLRLLLTCLALAPFHFGTFAGPEGRYLPAQ